MEEEIEDSREEPELLTPVESGQYIFLNSKHVKINRLGLQMLAEEIIKSMVENENKLDLPETGANIAALSKEDPRAIDFLFVADCLNFCFWTKCDCNEDDRWTVENLSGYYAMEAALHRAVKEGHQITYPPYYSKITKDELDHIFRSETCWHVPLLNERLEILHQVGGILIEKYNGTFLTCVQEANKSAIKLLEIVVSNFPSFQDEAVYKGKRVSFYKRAQILVADIWNFFTGKGLGEFYDIDKLTMFADYRVPQVLLHFQVLVYGKELTNDLIKGEFLPSGCEKEVEIRGCSIHAIEELKKVMTTKIEEAEKEKTITGLKVPNACLLDFYLWCYRRKHAEELAHIPFHKTIGIYY